MAAASAATGGLAVDFAHNLAAIANFQFPGPTAIQLSATSVNEKQPVGTLVGTLSSTDTQPGARSPTACRKPPPTRITPPSRSTAGPVPHRGRCSTTW